MITHVNCLYKLFTFFPSHILLLKWEKLLIQTLPTPASIDLDFQDQHPPTQTTQHPCVTYRDHEGGLLGPYLQSQIQVNNDRNKFEQLLYFIFQKNTEPAIVFFLAQDH